MKGEVGKETPKKEMDNPSFLDVFYDVTHDTFQRFLHVPVQFAAIPALHIINKMNKCPLSSVMYGGISDYVNIRLPFVP